MNPPRQLAAPRGERPDATKLPSSPGQRNPVSTVLAKLKRVIRGDKYMADASPAAWHSAAATRDGDRPIPPKLRWRIDKDERKGI